jgi:hypothetical protein
LNVKKGSAEALKQQQQQATWGGLPGQQGPSVIGP